MTHPALNIFLFAIKLLANELAIAKMRQSLLQTYIIVMQHYTNDIYTTSHHVL